MSLILPLGLLGAALMLLGSVARVLNRWPKRQPPHLIPRHPDEQSPAGWLDYVAIAFGCSLVVLALLMHIGKNWAPL